MTVFSTPDIVSSTLSRPRAISFTDSFAGDSDDLLLMWKLRISDTYIFIWKYRIISGRTHRW